MEKEYGFHRNTLTGCAAEGPKSPDLIVDLVELTDGCSCKKTKQKHFTISRRSNYCLSILFMWDFLEEACRRDN